MRLPVFHGRGSGFANMFRGIKIRLSNAQTDNIFPAFFKFAGPFRHGESFGLYNLTDSFTGLKHGVRHKTTLFLPSGFTTVQYL